MDNASFLDFGYEEVKIIGRGQYGKAHLVRSTKDQNFYIAKAIELICLATKERETALQEVTLLSRLNHPNIVKYYHNFMVSDTLVIIMQYCEGGDLSSYIKDMAARKLRIQEVQIMSFIVQALQALQYIHQERILHRDLKSCNLFLMKKKSVLKLGDFGISRMLEGSVEAAYTVVGTPYYMSPEVCENKAYTYKSDVWSLGCVLYELCMLKHAFFADNLLGLVYKIVSEKYEPIPRLYSQSLNSLIQRMLEKEAEKRPAVKDLFADPYVQSFMNEYVRTRGQCATPSRGAASRARDTVRGTGGTRGGAAAAEPGGGRSAGNAGATATGGRPRAWGSKERGRPPAALGTAAGGGIGVGAATGERSLRGRPTRPSRGLRAAAHEAPTEEAARQRREASSRSASEPKAVARQSSSNKLAEKRVDGAELVEFETVFPFGVAAQAREAAAARLDSVFAAGSPCGPAPPEDTMSISMMQSMSKPHDSWLQAAAALDVHPHERGSSGSSTPPQPSEEVSSSESSGDEYDDDFEEDVCSELEEIGEDSEIEELEFNSIETGAPAAREEQDITRVVTNCEQHLARVLSGASPMLRRANPDRVSVALVPGAVPCSHAPGFAHALTGGSSGPAPGGAVMDMRSRAARLQDDLVRKMGAQAFQRAFDCLYQARERSADERTVRRELEALIGRESCKLYCFDIDQLVFQRMLYP